MKHASKATVPPPGYDRDVELARALHMNVCDCPEPLLTSPWSCARHPDALLLPAFSTDPLACELLEAKLAERGYLLRFDMSSRLRRAIVKRGGDEGSAPSLAEGRDRCDAISAAALRALLEESAPSVASAPSIPASRAA